MRFLIFLPFLLIFNCFASVNIPVEKSMLNKDEVDEKLVKKWIELYSGTLKENFQRHLNRGENYRYVVESILEEEKMPLDLYYVGLIESGYGSRAKSVAKAVGHWQFIAGTGKRYGLMINKEVDERQHIYKSTLAAAKYLKDLHNIFHSWPLAMAAYNAGEFRILNAIRKGKTRNYKKLCDLKLLPKETRNYVAKTFAAKHIDKHRKLYGYKKPDNIDDIKLPLKPIPIFKQMTIYKAALKLGVPSKELLDNNPDLRRGIVYGTLKKPFYVYVSEEKYARWNKSLEAFSFKTGTKAISQVLNPAKFQSYGLETLKRGDKVELEGMGDGTIKVTNTVNGKEIIVSVLD